MKHPNNIRILPSKEVLNLTKVEVFNKKDNFVINKKIN